MSQSASRPTAPPPVPTLPAAEDVWPEAFFSVPRWFSDTRDVQPLAMLSEHEVLMADPDEHRPILVNYDRRTGRHKVLGTVPESTARYHRIENVTVSDSQIAWIAAVRHPDRTSPELQLWTMPITGGPVRFVALFSPDPHRPGGRDGRMYRLEVVGDQIVWWEDSGGSVYRVPLTGGTPTLMGSGYISTWPWVHDGKNTITNIVTGEKRSAEKVDGTDRRCGPEWCVSGVARAANQLTQVIVQRRDGSRRGIVPGGFRRTPLFHERFGFFDPPKVIGEGSSISTARVGRLENGSVIYDRCGDTSAALQLKEGKAAEYELTIQVGGSIPGGPLLFWRNDVRKRYTVMDLAAIPEQGC